VSNKRYVGVLLVLFVGGMIVADLREFVGPSRYLLAGVIGVVGSRLCHAGRPGTL
jgi:hypothetical protein